METQIENGVPVEVDRNKFVYASYSQIESSYYQHGNAQRAAEADGWMTYTDHMGRMHFKKKKMIKGEEDDAS